MAGVCRKRERLPSCLLIENAPGAPHRRFAPCPSRRGTNGTWSQKT